MYQVVYTDLSEPLIHIQYEKGNHEQKFVSAANTVIYCFKYWKNPSYTVVLWRKNFPTEGRYLMGKT